MTAILLATSTVAFATDGAGGYYTSKTPYVPQQSHVDYSPVPTGFSIHHLEHVARHGSRGLSSPGDDELALRLWEMAEAENALTPEGEALGAALRQIKHVHAYLGYGQISRRGQLEQAGMARRLLERHPELYDVVLENDLQVPVLHSGRSRAEASGEAFVAALREEAPELAGHFSKPRADLRTLYFQKAEGSEDYQSYRKDDPRLRAVIAGVAESSRKRDIARAALERWFSAPFVSRLDAGEILITSRHDPDDEISGVVSALDVFYGLYSISINLTEEIDPGFARYFSDEHLEWLAYADDLESFYARGPGFEGESVTYEAAGVLVEDFLSRIDARLSDPEAVSPLTLRFTHAQVLMPLVTWLGIEGATQGASASRVYDYANNPWRASWVSPMSANIQWEVYRNLELERVIVRMLHNEAETRFSPACQPIEAGSFFYELEALRACLGLTADGQEN